MHGSLATERLFEQVGMRLTVQSYVLMTVITRLFVRAVPSSSWNTESTHSLAGGRDVRRIHHLDWVMPRNARPSKASGSGVSDM